MNAEDLLRLKIRLLTEGATIPEGHWQGRKGGAGPVGGRYFLLPNNRSIGIPIRQGKMAERFKSLPLEPTNDPIIWVYDKEFELRLVPKPSFLDESNSEGIPFNQIALMHGDKCLATTVYQNCRHWSTGEQCRFCTIPTSLHSGQTTLEKTPDQIAEIVQAAEDVATHVLLTTGTPDYDDVGIDRLINIAKGIREISDIPIAVQFEPPLDNEIMYDLASAGVNAVGIHLESADDSVRKEMTPGKTKYGSVEMYRDTWHFAIKHFGRGNVSTFLLHGLGENIETTLAFIEDISKIGVFPIVAPVRPSPSSQLADFTPTYVGKLETSIQFYKEIGKILYSEKLNPMNTIGGCSRCGGCTPIQEAYDWAASQ
ncbi:MAG: radical SAM protein [Candidatus Thorarchaeota archaeon]